jgi:[ribosomal protein S5]-alanine N-acetyltransferase
MTEQPTLETPRLILRPFTLADASDVQRLAGDRAIASTTLNIPHPYELEMAEEWIGRHEVAFREGTEVTFATTLRDSRALIGAIGLGITVAHVHAEMGYWIGVPYWGNGYGTEAARAVVDYGFRTLGMNRILAVHFARNPASGRVMQKLGMTREGYLRQHVLKWGAYEDVVAYGILRSEWPL